MSSRVWNGVGGGAGRGAQVVERMHGARRGLVDEHAAAAAADAGHERLDDAQRRADGDRGVDSRAALEEHAQASGRARPCAARRRHCARPRASDTRQRVDRRGFGVRR